MPGPLRRPSRRWLRRLSETLPEGVLLAVDLGQARVGVAACDAGRVLAYPVETIPAGEGLPGQVKRLADQYGAVGLVVGYPLALDGTPGIAARHVWDQARALSKVVGLPTVLVDERMSTAQAQRRLREAGRNAKKARRVIDAQAAVGILELVIDAANQGMMIGQRLQEDADGWSQ